MVAILGISAFYHDSGAALLIDGQIIAACQEERFSRIKNDARFPAEAIAYCLDHASLPLGEVDHIVFYEKPFLKFERLLDTQMAFAPMGVRAFAKAMPVWIKEKLFQKSTLLELFQDQDPDFEDRGQLSFGEHHLSHLASAFYPAPFEEALILSIDGVGERTTTSVAIGKGREIEIVREIHFPHSLGLLYLTFTEYLGFRVNYDEYKVMGLAPYGTAKFRREIYDNLIELRDDGSFWMDQTYFGYAHSLHSINRRFCNLFGPGKLPIRREARTFKEEIYSAFPADSGYVDLTGLFAEWGDRKAIVDTGHYSPNFSRFVARRIADSIELQSIDLGPQGNGFPTGIPRQRKFTHPMK